MQSFNILVCFLFVINAFIPSVSETTLSWSRHEYTLDRTEPVHCTMRAHIHKHTIYFS